MERVIALLREKNHCLERFYWLNEQELINFGVGNFDSLNEFYQARETLLGMIGRVDESVEEMNKTFTGTPGDDERREVEAILNAKNELVKAVLAQDLQIIAYIDKEKSNIIREMRSTTQAKRAVGAYASAERMKQMDQE